MEQKNEQPIEETTGGPVTEQPTGSVAQGDGDAGDNPKDDQPADETGD